MQFKIEKIPLFIQIHRNQNADYIYKFKKHTETLAYSYTNVRSII